MKLRALFQSRSMYLKLAAVVYAILLSTIIFLNNYHETQHLFLIFATVPYLDKVGHLFVMGCFSFLVNLALSGRSVRISNFKYLLGSTVVFVLATLEEISQLFVRGRDFEFSDIFFNTLGIILFGEAARLIIRIVAHMKTDSGRRAKIS